MHEHQSPAIRSVPLAGTGALVGVLRRAYRIEVGNVLPMRIMRSRARRCKAVGGLLLQAGHAPYARGTRPWKQLPACIVCMLYEAPAKSAEASVGEEEHIRARIEVVGQDNYSSRTGQK